MSAKRRLTTLAWACPRRAMVRSLPSVRQATTESDSMLFISASLTTTLVVCSRFRLVKPLSGKICSTNPVGPVAPSRCHRMVFASSSVALSDNGSRIAIVAAFSDANGKDSGRLRMFEYHASAELWFQVGQDIDREDTRDLSG